MQDIFQLIKVPNVFIFPMPHLVHKSYDWSRLKVSFPFSLRDGYRAFEQLPDGGLLTLRNVLHTVRENMLILYNYCVEEKAMGE